MVCFSPAALACAAAVAVISIAQGETIDFSSFNSEFPELYIGTPIANQYAGVVFSLQGGPDSSGPPTLNDGYAGPGLGNSSYGDSSFLDEQLYPTANILNMAFTTPVTGVSFSFANFGTSAPTTFTAFNAAGGVVDSGDLQYVSTTVNCAGDQIVAPVPDCYQLITVAGSGITDLQINNNYGSNSWIFGIEELNFTPMAVSAPEPSAFLLVLTALLAGAMVARGSVRSPVPPLYLATLSGFRRLPLCIFRAFVYSLAWHSPRSRP